MEYRVCVAVELSVQQASNFCPSVHPGVIYCTNKQSNKREKNTNKESCSLGGCVIDHDLLKNEGFLVDKLEVPESSPERCTNEFVAHNFVTEKYQIVFSITAAICFYYSMVHTWYVYCPNLLLEV